MKKEIQITFAVEVPRKCVIRLVEKIQQVVLHETRERVGIVSTVKRVKKQLQK